MLKQNCSANLLKHVLSLTLSGVWDEKEDQKLHAFNLYTSVEKQKVAYFLFLFFKKKVWGRGNVQKLKPKLTK